LNTSSGDYGGLFAGDQNMKNVLRFWQKNEGPAPSPDANESSMPLRQLKTNHWYSHYLNGVLAVGTKGHGAIQIEIQSGNNVLIQHCKREAVTCSSWDQEAGGDAV
jgi:hypothetical protein